MKSLKGRILTTGILAVVLLALVLLPQMTVKAETANAVIRFSDSYKKMGDILVVENAPEGIKYKWTVKSQINGKTVHSETNETGTLQTTADYEECLITCQIGTQKLNMYCSRLPVVYIESETEYYGVAKEQYNNAELKLVGNEKYDDESLWYEGDAEIKLRGNSTAYRDKRPFKLKLGSKADLLGLGTEDDGTSYESKHWVLLANDIDHSLMRNKLLYDFSGAIGTEFYFHSDNVVLIYNGEYQGVYQLCEHRRVDEGRIDIVDWMATGENAVKAIAKAEYAKQGYTDKGEFQDVLEAWLYQDYSWMDTGSITFKGTTYNFKDYGVELPKADGGYLAEMDFYSIGSDTQATIGTAYGQPLYFGAPEAGADAASVGYAVESFKNTDLYEFAKRYTQTFEYALHSQDFTFKSGIHSALVSVMVWDSQYSWEDGWISPLTEVEYNDEENEGKHYSELFDMDSLVTNFIFVEYAMNWDSMKNSFFYYKDEGELAKIGPQWDFDWAWGNINMFNIFTNYPTNWHTTLEDFTKEQSYQSYNWNRLLIKDPYFVVRAYEKYHEVRQIIEEMIKDGGVIDTYHEYLKKAGQANDARWKYTYNRHYYGGGNPEKFDASVKSIKNFLTTRVKWLDEQFKSVDSLMSSLGYYASARDIELAAETTADKSIVTATVSNVGCKTVVFQINGTYKEEVEVVDGKAVLEVPKEVLIIDGTTMNVAVGYETGANGDYLVNNTLKPSGNYEYIAKSDYVAFVNATPTPIPTSTPIPSPTPESSLSASTPIPSVTDMPGTTAEPTVPPAEQTGAEPEEEFDYTGAVVAVGCVIVLAAGAGTCIYLKRKKR